MFCAVQNNDQREYILPPQRKGFMKLYKIQHKIHTLIQNAAGVIDNPATFKIQDITFKQEDFSMFLGWPTDYWIAESEIEARSGIDAVNIFRKKLDLIAGGICLVGQAYFMYKTCSFLVTRDDSDEALFFYYEEQKRGNPLMLLPEQIEGVNKVISSEIDFSIFLEYWTQITNTPDIVAKIILYCAALDALTKAILDKKWEEQKHLLRESILGRELKEVLFGTKKNSSIGLRHRLIHGEYLAYSDDTTLEEIHECIIKYFNNSILKHKYIMEDVVNPQRNPYKNYEQFNRFIKFKESKKRTVSELEKDFSENKDNKHNLKTFEFLSAQEHNQLTSDW